MKDNSSIFVIVDKFVTELLKKTSAGQMDKRNLSDIKKEKSDIFSTKCDSHVTTSFYPQICQYLALMLLLMLLPLLLLIMLLLLLSHIFWKIGADFWILQFVLSSSKCFSQRMIQVDLMNKLLHLIFVQTRSILKNF